MKKINNKRLIIFTILIIIISLLKANYQMYNPKEMIVFWDSEQLVNLIWLFPIVFIILVLSKDLYNKITNFDLRYKSRKRYINKTLLKTYLYFSIYIILTQLFQIILINILTRKNILINLEDILFIFDLNIEILCIISTISLIAILIKNYMYSFVINISLILIILVLLINIKVINNNIYLPFIRLYTNANGTIITIIILIIELFLIKRKYLKLDIFGGENYESNS